MWRGWKGDAKAALIGFLLVPVLFYVVGGAVIAIAMAVGDGRILTGPANAGVSSQKG